MTTNSSWQHYVGAIALVLLATSLAAAQTAPPPKPVEDCVHSITQSFPTSGPAVTTWTICWREVAGNDSLDNPNGLVIGPVFFQKSPTAAQVFLIYDMRISEIFVPYHSGSPRFYDLSDFNFTLMALTTTDCGTGTLVSADVCKEVRDRGLMWKDPNTFASHRGEELVLWGIIDADNYLYLEEYTFRDDGVILGRMAATGQNLPGDEEEAHSHSPFWRIDMDLDGPTNDTAQLQHLEDIHNSAGTASDPSFAIATEEGFTWDPRTHDSMVISNSGFKNAQGHLSTYHIVAQPTGGGLTQDFETFTQNDFWVTPYDPSQFAARHLADTYIPQGRSVADTDIVAWFKGSLHHHPRDEDGVFDSQNNFVGVTDTMWTGFMLMPNDFFDCSPLYPLPNPSCPATVTVSPP